MACATDLAWYFLRIMIFSPELKISVEFAGTYPHSVPAGSQAVEDTMHRENLDCQAALFPAKSYVLNEFDCFVWFSPEWNREFQQTFSEPYEVSQYLGRSFFDLLAGTGIRLIYRSLFKLIRQLDSRPMSLTMRCDRYPLRIILSQELSSQDKDQIRVEIAYIKCERVTDETSLFHFDKEKPLKMCSWCQSIQDSEHSTWLPLEKALGLFPLLHETELPVITHGCCPACFQTLRGKVYEYSCGR
jgi:hypothetical protein